MAEMVSISKIAYHKQKLEAYLRREPIFPVTLELGLTAKCNRKCPDCPSSLGSEYMSLSLDYVERLFSYIQGQTKGLIITGGEPTLSPVFTQVVMKARRNYQFEDIAVVTNGSCLDNEKVVSVLISDASVVRVSLYDWNAKTFDGLFPTLHQIEALRKRIDKSGSKLDIGISVLTSDENAGVLGKVTELAYSAGAHWIYFHPTCTKDVSGTASRVSQKSVLNKIKEYKSLRRKGFDIFVLNERYDTTDVEFEGYHTSHFVLVIGADGKNYLATEVKYQPKYVISDLTNASRDDFLWQSPRLERIHSVTSYNYSAKGSRNRGVLYNTFIENLKHGNIKLSDDCCETPVDEFRLPHII